MADGFYETIPVLDNFADAVRGENFRPLPDGWVVGFADVVGSTKAVADGRYKAVNMVGAGAIAAGANAPGPAAVSFRLWWRRGELRRVVVRCDRRRQGASGDGRFRA